MYREIYKLQQRNFNGFRRTNHSTDLHTADIKSIVYKLVPVGIARHTHLRNKAINILGENQLRVDCQWHPLLDLLIFKIVLYQSMPNGLDENLQEKLKRDLSSDLKNKEYDHFRCLFEAVVNRIGKGRYIDHLKGRPRVEKLKQLKAIIEKESELALCKAEEYVLNSRKKQAESSRSNTAVVDQKKLEETERNEVRLLVREQMRSILAIEPLTRAQQHQKFRLFQRKHSVAFQTVLQLDNTNRYYFLMARFSTEPEPVLQKLSQFISMRIEGTDYRELTMHFIKDIYSQIKQYDKKVIMGYSRRSPYPSLSPDAIVLDQFALKPLLHFQPLLNQTLGLRDNPDSVECRLTLSPTPRGPDYFRALQQYSPNRQVIEQDPFYGCIQLYEKEKEFLSQDQKREIEGERSNLERESDSILAWRFLLLSYFILNGEEFGRPQAPTSHQQAIASFLLKLREKQTILSQNAEELGQFVGFTSNKVEGAQFKGQFAELEDFISGERDDSIICSHGHDRLLRYLALRWLLVKESNAMLHSKDKEAFSRMLNAKKYVIIFLLVAYQYFSECQQFLICEQDRTGQRKMVQELVLKMVPRVNKDGPEDYMKKLFDRITGYRKRDSNDPGYVYLTENQDYLYNLLSNYNKKLKELKINCQQLNALEKEEEIKDRELYKDLVEKTARLISNTVPEIETLLKEIIYIEVEQPRHCENLHKPEKISRQGWEVVTSRFLLIVFTLLSITEEKYPLYDSLVVPFLSLAELSPRSEQNLLNAPRSREQIAIQKAQLSTVESIIDYKQLLPLKLAMVRPRFDIYHAYI